MDKPAKFTSYNQITKEFDVMILNQTEIKQLNNDDHFLVLKPKKEVAVPTKMHHKSHKSKLDLILERLDRLEQMVIQDHNLLVQTNNLLIKVIKLNNLKTE